MRDIKHGVGGVDNKQEEQDDGQVTTKGRDNYRGGGDMGELNQAYANSGCGTKDNLG